MQMVHGRPIGKELTGTLVAAANTKGSKARGVTRAEHRRRRQAKKKEKRALSIEKKMSTNADKLGLRSGFDVHHTAGLQLIPCLRRSRLFEPGRNAIQYSSNYLRP